MRNLVWILIKKEFDGVGNEIHENWKREIISRYSYVRVYHLFLLSVQNESFMQIEIIMRTL